jgi:hypothetical protein
LLVAAPTSARAESPGTLGVSKTTKLVTMITFRNGEIPAKLIDPRLPATSTIDWKTIGAWVQLTGGLTTDDQDTDFGSQLGVEWSLRLGAQETEVPEYRTVVPLGFDGGLALALRTVAWNYPFEGAVVVLIGGELGAGGGHWWSDTVRGTFFGGARMVTRGRDNNASFELSYFLAPWVFSGTPGDLRSRRVEHRLGATFALSTLGVGAWVTGVSQSVQLPGESEFLGVGGVGFGISIELRF